MLNSESLFSSGLSKKSLALLESNIIVSVRQKEGMILNTHCRISPTSFVDSIIFKIKTTIEPMPAKTKWIKMVIV